jgi:hypothetical protein
MTYSVWAKIGTLGTQRLFYEGFTSVSDFEGLVFNTSDQLEWTAQVDGGSSYGVRTPAVFRDPSAWYHIVCAVDTTQATSTNRVRIYVNGVEQTGLTTFYSGFPAQNTDLEWNNQSSTQVIGWGGHFGYYDGYMAEINMIDGQALTPSSFGETSATTGVWIPKKFSGTYGTNGFYLKFTDTTSTSTLGTDFSGNSNTWTVNNISLTAGTTYDSMTDVPTLTSATTANYAVINPLFIKSTFVLSSANLSVTNTTESQGKCFSTIGVSSGKWYWESQQSTTTAFAWMLGVSQLANETNYFGQDSISWGWGTNNEKYFNGTATAYGTSTNSSSEVYMVALDCDNGKLWFGMNGTWFSSGNPASNTNESFSGLSGTLFAGARPYGGNVGAMNFGQRPFTYTPPTGFVRLNTFNLTTPTIGATASTTANKYMDIALYTGNGTTQSITNSSSMQPDWVWLKCRSTNYRNQLYDAVRGVTKALFSDSTDAEGTFQGVTAFNANGFSLGAELGANASGDTFVGWQWRASNTTAVTNTNGSITSSVSANTTAGFSIVTYTGTGSAATIGHGLGVAPRMYIVKSRDSDDWVVYHASLPSAANYLTLNTTNAQASNVVVFNSTAPTSSVFSVGSSRSPSGVGMVAYCFSEVTGYSAFGSYTGNGSTDGTFIFTGFRPRYLMIKSTSVESWELFDTSRSPYNQAIALLEADSSGAENNSNTSAIDILSNGFKQRNTRAATNGSGTTYIYMAFAENPFKYSLAR